MPCHYCSVLPERVVIAKSFGEVVRHGGVDRPDNSLGYSDGNMVPCCEKCNKGKNNNTVDGFLFWAANLGVFQAAKAEFKMAGG